MNQSKESQKLIPLLGTLMFSIPILLIGGYFYLIISTGLVKSIIENIKDTENISLLRSGLPLPVNSIYGIFEMLFTFLVPPLFIAIAYKRIMKSVLSISKRKKKAITESSKDSILNEIVALGSSDEGYYEYKRNLLSSKKKEVKKRVLVIGQELFNEGGKNRVNEYYNKTKEVLSDANKYRQLGAIWREWLD